MGREGLCHLTTYCEWCQRGVTFDTATDDFQSTVYIDVLVFWGIFSHVFMFVLVMQLLYVVVIPAWYIFQKALG